MDRDNLYAAYHFAQLASRNGLRPLIGMEANLFYEGRKIPFRLLAKNNQGYKNLMKIVTRGFTEGYYYKPRVDYEVLEKYHEGIIELSACLAGEIPNKILKEDFDGARAAANKMRDIFGENNFFLELQDHGIRQQTQVNTSLIRLSRELGIPMVVTNDVHYIREEDAVPHDLLLCIQTGKKVSDQDRMRYEGGQYYLKSEEEMQKRTENLFRSAPNRYAPARVGAYLDEALGLDVSMELKEKGVQTKEEALMIAAAMLYAKNAEFPYEVRIKDEKVSTKIADISNVVISRK